MEIDHSLVEKLAQLAKLEFDDRSKEEIRADIEKILSFMDKLNELDTTGVEPLRFINENVNVLRKDEVMQTITTEQALKNAPVKNDQFIKVPKMIRKKE